MDKRKILLLRAKVKAYVDILANAPSRSKEEFASAQIAERLNGILEDIKREIPDAAEDLPPAIASDHSLSPQPSVIYPSTRQNHGK